MSDLTRCKPSATKDLIKQHSLWQKTRPRRVSTDAAFNKGSQLSRSQSTPCGLTNMTSPPAYGSSNTTLPAYSEAASEGKKAKCASEEQKEPLDPELAASATEEHIMKHKKGISVWGVKRKPVYGGGMSDAHQSSWSRGYGQGKLW